MNQPLDDFDDDITVPAALRNPAQQQPMLDDFDDDITVPAVHTKQPTPPVQDDFGDDATMPFTPRVNSSPTVPFPKVKLPEPPRPSIKSVPTPQPAKLQRPPSSGTWQPPRRPTAPAEPEPTQSTTGRTIALIVALLLLAALLIGFVILRNGANTETNDELNATAAMAVYE